MKFYKGPLKNISTTEITTNTWELVKEFEPYPQTGTERIYLYEEFPSLTCTWDNTPNPYIYSYTGNITGTISGLDNPTDYYVESRSYVKYDIYYVHGTTAINADGTFGPVLNWTGYKQIAIKRNSDDTLWGYVNYEAPPDEVFQVGNYWRRWNMTDLTIYDSRSKTDMSANWSLDTVNYAIPDNSLESDNTTTNEYVIIQSNIGSGIDFDGDGFIEFKFYTEDPGVDTFDMGMFFGGGGWSGDDDYEHGMILLVDQLNDQLRLCRFDSDGTYVIINSQAVVIPWGEWVRVTATFTKAGNQISVTGELLDAGGASLGTVSGNYTDADFGGEFGLFTNHLSGVSAKFDAFRISTKEKLGGGNREDDGEIFDDYDYFDFITGWVEGVGGSYGDYEVEVYGVSDAEYLQNTKQIDGTTGFWSCEKTTGASIPIAKFINSVYAANLNKLIRKVDSEVMSTTYKSKGLMRSYVPPPDEPDPVGYEVLIGRMYAYDQATSLLAACILDDWEWADKLAGGALRILDVGQEGQAPFSVSTVTATPPDMYLRTGASMWVIYALSKYYNIFNDTQSSENLNNAYSYVKLYIDDCIENYWVTDANYQQYSFKGGKGRYVGGIFDDSYIVPWCSTEHNVDACFALNEVNTMYPGEGYDTYRDNLETALTTNFWNSTLKRANQGVSDGTTYDTSHALDCGSWYACFCFASGNDEKGRMALESIAPYVFLDTDIMGSGRKGCGYTAYILAHYPLATYGMWIEGTAGCALAFLSGGHRDMAIKIINNCFRAKLTGTEKYEKGYPYTTVADPVYELTTYSSVASTVWLILGAYPNGNGVNLFGVNDNILDS